MIKLDFGYRYTKEETNFRVYATRINSIYIRIYENDSYRSNDYEMIENANFKNVFEITIKGNLKNRFYSYVVNRGEETFVVADPYSFAMDINSKRSYIFDYEDVKISNFDEDLFINKNLSESIIYETHIRDMTMHKSANVKNKGKFLGVIENEEDKNYGLNYIKNLGITHIHYLPIQDIASLDDLDNTKYNWGYDPMNYFNIEGTYSINPKDPISRIKEFKTFVKKHHDASLGVIMDVVYNHVYEERKNPLYILSKETYFRLTDGGYLSNGSGCGNELNTENPVTRKLIIDSLKYFATEFHIDGFRFDLMGLIDSITMSEISKELSKINKNVILYGEPWIAQGTTLSEELRTDKSKHIKNLAMFNDDFRNALKGSPNSKERGYIQGNLYKTHDILTGICGSIHFNDVHIGFANEPYESINYMSCHDNFTLFDKIKLCDFNDFDNENITKVGFSILLLSFGVPFIHAGSEFLRTKNMVENSYNSSDEINAIDWSMIQKTKLPKYVKELIYARKEMEFFSKFNADDIRKNVKFINCGGLISYQIKYNKKTYYIVINPTPHQNYLNVNEIKNTQVIKMFDNGYIEFKKRKKELMSDYIILDGYSSIIIYKENE